MMEGMTAGFREKALTPSFSHRCYLYRRRTLLARRPCHSKLPRHVTSANCRGGMGYQ